MSAATAGAAVVPPHCVAILDAGAQYSKVIDRRVRELSVEAHILPLHTRVEALQQYAAIIISGGPQSVYGAEAPVYDERLFKEYTKPILGICYGMQLMNYASGGKVEKGGVREDGQFVIQQRKLADGSNSKLYANLSDRIEVLLTHGDRATELAPGFEVTATSGHDGIIASIENTQRKLYGVQYHPEVDLTPEGMSIFQNFLVGICGLPRSFTLSSRKTAAIAEIRQLVGEENKVLCLLSGGVDSSVCAALLKEAIGAERIIAIHIDNGFMRFQESARVVQALESIGLKIHLIDARARFYHGKTTINGTETGELCHVTAPEVKRKIIGDTFMRVCDEELRKLGLVPDHVFLAQGTLRPDLIESASHLASSAGNADVIKTHHNDTALVRELRAKGRICEPLRDLHKDEVRLLGLELGLPSHLVWRQPFPGPGLAVRILCATEPFVNGKEQDILAGLKSYTTEAIHASLLACRTVGVQGDSRSYSSLVALSSCHVPTTPSSRQISHIDFNPDWSKLFELAKEIPKKIHGVNRVVYVFGSKLTRDYYKNITSTLANEQTVTQLQLADEIVNKTLMKYKLSKSLSQVPVILFPIDFEDETHPHNKGKRSICIRTFVTNDFMTGVPALPCGTLAPQDQNGRAVIESIAVAGDTVEELKPTAHSAPVVTIDSSSSSHSLTAVEAAASGTPNVHVTNLRFPTMPLAALQEMVTEILTQVPDIARVCFDLTCKPPATTEWE